MLRDVLILTRFLCCCFCLCLLIGVVDVGVDGVPSGCGCKNSSSQSSGNNSRSITCFLGLDVDVDVGVGVDDGINSRVSHNSPTFVHNCCVRCKKYLSLCVYDKCSLCWCLFVVIMACFNGGSGTSIPINRDRMYENTWRMGCCLWMT